MYDRYKSKRRDYGILKLVIIIVVAVGVVTAVYKNRHFWMIWKYSDSKLQQKVNKAVAIKDREKRLKGLKELRPVIVRHKEQNPFHSGAYTLAGELHFRIGETRLGDSFTDLCIRDRATNVPKLSRRDFTRAIKNFRKATAIQDSDELEQKYAFMFARSCYYTSFLTPAEILAELNRAVKNIDPAGLEERRFYALILVLNNNADKGLALLAPGKGKTESVKEKLYRASLERLGKKYTAAIMTYKDVIASTQEPDTTRLVHENLGKIYFNQALYRESMDQFAIMLAADDKDATAKIWMGKNLAATGEKDRAKALWNEVLSADEKNREAKDLLDAK